MQATRPVIGTVLRTDVRTIEDGYEGTVVAVPEVGINYQVIIRETDDTYVVLDDTGEIVGVCPTLAKAEEQAYGDLINAAICELLVTIPETATVRAMVQQLLRARQYTPGL